MSTHTNATSGESRIATTFARCRAQNRAAFIPFIMGGDPSLDACAKLLDTLAQSGADIIELGLPFSDPMADGPTIEAAGNRALDAGATLEKLIHLASQFRSRHAEIPLVLMGYLNPIHAYGYERFARDAQTAGVDGIILVDLPPEEAAELEALLSNHSIALIRLIAPTSVPGRLKLLTDGAQGYLYYIAMTGITGATNTTSTDHIAGRLDAIRAHTKLPICVGFGVKTAADVTALANYADGVVVGSAIVKHIHDTHADTAQLSRFVRTLADGCKK